MTGLTELERELLETLKFYASEWQSNADGDDSEPHLYRTWMEPTDALFDDAGRKASDAITKAEARNV